MKQQAPITTAPEDRTEIQARPARRRIRRQFDPSHPLDHHPSVLLGHENAASFEFVRQSLNSKFMLKDDYEQILSELAAQNIWRALRAVSIEAAGIDTQVADQSAQIDREYEEIDNECRTYLAIRDLTFAQIRRGLKDDEFAYTRRVLLLTKELKRN